METELELTIDVPHQHPAGHHHEEGVDGCGSKHCAPVGGHQEVEGGPVIAIDRTKLVMEINSKNYPSSGCQSDSLWSWEISFGPTSCQSGTAGIQEEWGREKMQR